MTKEDLIKQEQQQIADQTVKLEQLKKLRELQQQHEQLQWQTRAQRFEPITRKIQTGTVSIKQLSVNAKPYIKQAYQEVKPGVKTAAHSVGQAATSYIHHIATSSPKNFFILTPKGRAALQSYHQGDYSVIPANSVRAELLSTGSFTLGGAVNMFGDNGAMAAQLLAEQGLIQKV